MLKFLDLDVVSYVFLYLFLKNCQFFYVSSVFGGKIFKKLIQILDYEGLIVSERKEKYLPSIQESRLKVLFSHASQSVPYWKTRLSQESRLCDIQVIDKQEVKKDLRKFINANATSLPQLEDVTSGTSGVPFSFLSDKRFLLRRSVTHRRNNSWTGHAEVDNTLRVLRREIPGLEKLGLFYKFSSQETLTKDKDYLYSILSSRVKVLYALSSFLASLVELAEKDKVFFDLKAIVSTGEKLPIFYRELCKRVFGCQIFDSYSTREFGRIAQECVEHNGMHINSEMFLIEVVDERGKVLGDGVEGRIIITAFDNYVMPFIRYDVGDLGRVTKKACDCGRVLPRLFLSGRTSEVILLSNGRKVYPAELYGIFNRRYLEIKQFQIKQRTVENVSVNVVPAIELTEVALERIQKEIESKIGNNVSITVVTVPKLDLTLGGKTPVFISEL